MNSLICVNCLEEVSSDNRKWVYCKCGKLGVKSFGDYVKVRGDYVKITIREVNKEEN